MKIVAIDPGGTTGISWADVEGVGWVDMLKESLGTMQLGTNQEDYSALKLFGVIMHQQPDVLVMEDFRLFPDRRHSSDTDGTLPMRYLARLDLMLYLHSQHSILMVPTVGGVSVRRGALALEVAAPQVFKQMPGERMGVTDEWLKGNGLWRTPKQGLGGGGPHAMDALRHLVTFLRKHEGKVGWLS